MKGGMVLRRKLSMMIATILLLSIASIMRILLKTTNTEERITCVQTKSESYNIRLRS